jgi:AcrR family transcriptional regulator
MGSPSATSRRSIATREAPIDGSRQRIHAAALYYIGRLGFEGVSLQMIADEVGLHKSTLFHHYPTKLHIAIEVVETTLDRVVQILRPLGHGTPRIDDLMTCIDALTDWMCAEPDAARLLMAFITAPKESDLHTPVQSRASELQAELFGLLGTWLERARRSGVIRPLNIRQAIVNLVGLVLFYPAVAEHLGGGLVAGTERFSPKAVRIRKEELRLLVRSMLTPSRR